MINAEARRAERLALEHPNQGRAHDYVLRANAEANQSIVTRDSIKSACTLFAQALVREPDNADALAGIACLRVRQVVSGYLEAGRTVREERAREACLAEAEEKLAAALAVSPTHHKALQARRAAAARARPVWSGTAAAEALLLYSPGDPVGLREIGMSLLYLGRAEEAVPWFRRVDALAPGDPVRWTWLQGLGRALIQLGHDRDAVATLRLRRRQ